MSARNRQRWWSVCCALAALCWCSEVAAQVVVLRVEPDAESVCRDVEAQLSEWAPIKDPGYYQEAQREGLDPTGEDAMLRLIPPLNVRLAVVPMSADENGATVDLRDGTSGASVEVVQVPIEDGRLRWETVREAVANHLGSSASPEAGATPAAASDGEFPALHVRVSGGVGVGSRSVNWPNSGETWAVETGMFAAFDLNASFHIAVSSACALGLDLSYQTSVGAKVTENHVAAATEDIGIRSNELAGLFAIALGGPSFTITPAVGYGTRGLRPAVHHLLTPSGSLAGPLARLGARLAITDAVALRVVPEAQYVLVGDAFQELGIARTGLGVGGEVALEVAVSAEVSLELSGRIAHAWMDTTSGTSAQDTERFATARLVWQP